MTAAVDAMLLAAPPTEPPSPQPRPPLTAPDADRLVLIGTSPHGLPEIAIDVGGIWHRLELAADRPSRQRGMGGRSTIRRGTGMLFVHPDDDVRRYWMLDCLVDMDVAFLDRRGTVLAIHRMTREAPRTDGETTTAYRARLARYSSLRAARYALELASGEMTRLEIKVGERLPLPTRALDAHNASRGGT